MEQTDDEVLLAFELLKTQTLAFNDAIVEFAKVYNCKTVGLNGWISDNLDTLFDIDSELEENEEEDDE